MNNTHHEFLNLFEWAPGVYFVKLIFDDGLVNFRLVVE